MTMQCDISHLGSPWRECGTYTENTLNTQSAHSTVYTECSTYFVVYAHTEYSVYAKKQQLHTHRMYKILSLTSTQNGENHVIHDMPGKQQTNVSCTISPRQKYKIKSIVKTNICYPRKKYTKYTNRNHISCAQFHCEQNVKQLPIATEQQKIFMKSLIQERCHKTMIF